MDLLQKELARKRKAKEALGGAAAASDGKKRWVRQSELAELRSLEQVAAGEQKERDQKAASDAKRARDAFGGGVSGLLVDDAGKGGDGAIAGRDAVDDDDDADAVEGAAGGDDNDGDEDGDPELPKEEIVRRLRLMGQPVTLFGEASAHRRRCDATRTRRGETPMRPPLPARARPLRGEQK
jgi:pre-mRNA-splicing factor 18